jgi:glycosyltransferase involved in cell wall biosynthesis
MNLWLFNHYAGLPSTVPATRPYDIARYLVRLGHSVTIFASAFNHYTFVDEHLRFWEFYKSTEAEGVRIIWLKGTAYRGNDWRRLLNMLCYCLFCAIVSVGISKKPDVIMGTTVHPFAPLCAYFVSRIRKARFWLDITDIWPESLIELGHLRAASLTAKVMRGIEDFSLRKAELVSSVLPKVDAYLRDRDIPSKPTVWIPNGIAIDRMGAAPETEQNRDSFTVMYSGGFARAHALDVVLEAALRIQTAGLDNIRFILVGDGPEMSGVRTFIGQHRLRNVELPGFIPKIHLYHQLAKADVFLVTGRPLSVYRYGISFNKLFDYFLVARPIIFALRCGCDPVAESGAGLSVPPEDPGALMEAILKIERLPNQIRREMGQRGRDYVLSKFNYAAIAERLSRCF